MSACTEHPNHQRAYVLFGKRTPGNDRHFHDLRACAVTWTPQMQRDERAAERRAMAGQTDVAWEGTARAGCELCVEWAEKYEPLWGRCRLPAELAK